MKRPNIALLQHPYTLCERGNKQAVFRHPGFEPEDDALRMDWMRYGYDIYKLLDWSALEHIDASVRFDYRHALARLDGEAIEATFKEPLARLLDNKQWMSGDTYTRWPLRDNQINTTWRTNIDGCLLYTSPSPRDS